jgi:CheY-like chemotaxis protein
MAGQAILIVDDELTYLRLMRHLLQLEGYEVRIAADAEQALDILQTFRAQLILMDIQLPQTDGLDLTRRLKASPSTRELIIVAVSGWTSPHARRDAFAAGCAGYIAKPFDPQMLKRLIPIFLRRNESEAAEPV